MGKSVRSARLKNAAGSILMVPLDHGMSMGPMAGLEDPARVLERIAGQATCVAAHKGLIRHAAPHARDLGLLLHVSASTDGAIDPLDKRLVGTVEEAVRMGCDGLSIHVNVGSPTESRQLEDAGHVSTACAEWGMPLLAMMYPRGPNVKDPFDARLVAHAARLGAELGADIVKVPYTGSRESFERVVHGATVPIVVAGGPRRERFEEFLQDLQGAVQAGAAGVSVGRNVFQHPDPAAAMSAIARMFP
jgi:predicted phospho-2-dehydro-3-deoxyheptonate aldolase